MAPQTIGAPPSTSIDINSHLSILALLPEYVTQQVLGQQPHPDWRPLELHLTTCAGCGAEHATLLQQMQEVYAGSLPAVPFTPSLPAFLKPPPAALAPTPSQPLYHVAFSAGLLTQMRVRMAARAGEMRLRYAYTFPTLKDDDPAISVEVLSADEQAAKGVARICVELADRQPFDQAGSQVILTCGNLNLSGVTDSSGLVLFNDVPLVALADWQISVVPPAPD